MIAFHVVFDGPDIMIGCTDKKHWVSLAFPKGDTESLNLLEFLDLFALKVEAAILTVKDLQIQEKEVLNAKTKNFHDRLHPCNL